MGMQKQGRSRQSEGIHHAAENLARLHQKPIGPESEASDAAAQRLQQDEKKKTKVRWLKMEGRMVELDCKIKDSLSVTRPNCSAAIVALDELNTLSLAPLMLLKHPYVVQTIMKLKRYIGPKDSPEYTSEQRVSE